MRTALIAFAFFSDGFLIILSVCVCTRMRHTAKREIIAFEKRFFFWQIESNKKKERPPPSKHECVPNLFYDILNTIRLICTKTESVEINAIWHFTTVFYFSYSYVVICTYLLYSICSVARL